MKSSGTLVFDPPRKGLVAPWWCVLETDPELARYYRDWVRREYQLHDLLEPSWGSHVSVTRGEEPVNKDRWAAYQGLRVEFEYVPYVRWTGDFQDTLGNNVPGRFWFLDCWSQPLSQIRKELGLPAFDGKFHLTVAKRKFAENLSGPWKKSLAPEYHDSVSSRERRALWTKL